LTEQVQLPEIPVQALASASSVTVSSLSNGIKVASFSPIAYGGASVGLFVNASARHQTPQTHGSVNVLKQLFFKVENFFSSLGCSVCCWLIDVMWATTTTTTTKKKG